MCRLRSKAAWLWLGKRTSTAAFVTNCGQTLRIAALVYLHYRACNLQHRFALEFTLALGGASRSALALRLTRAIGARWKY